jgi:multidrug transporter EmrE-like cation transporter
MNFIFLIIALTLNALANILLKIGAMSDKGTSIKALLTNPYAIVGVIIFASNVYFYIQALRVLPVSLVYPVLTAAGFLVINTFGFIYLKESFTLSSLFGYIFIITGIIIITFSTK